jgi:hypothetical protein
MISTCHSAADAAIAAGDNGNLAVKVKGPVRVCRLQSGLGSEPAR